MLSPPRRSAAIISSGVSLESIKARAMRPAGPSGCSFGLNSWAVTAAPQSAYPRDRLLQAGPPLARRSAPRRESRLALPSSGPRSRNEDLLYRPDPVHKRHAAGRAQPPPAWESEVLVFLRARIAHARTVRNGVHCYPATRL